MLAEQKQKLYEELEQFYGLTRERIPHQYGAFFDAINVMINEKTAFDITRKTILILHARSQKKQYKETVAIEAFNRLVALNLQRTEVRIKRFQEKFAAKDETLKKKQQQINEQAAKIEEMQRLAAIGQTAGMVGHDIRNPLQSITGEMYLIKNELATLPDGDAKSNVQESIKLIQENILYINKIVADLQDYAKHLMPRREVVKVDEAVKNALAAADIPYEVKVTIQINNETAASMYADKDMVRRILTNLIQNAVQAMPDGGQLTIQANTHKKTTITITDTGVGIPKGVKEKIFTPLFTTKAKGQGLGLAVVKRLVEAQEGTIRFESEEGKGTTFILEFLAAPPF